MTAPKAAAHDSTPQHPSPPSGAEAGQLDWLLDDLVRRVPSVRHALVLSGDGLARGASSALSREDGEQLAAVASGLHSLGRGVGSYFETGEVRQTLVELDDAFLLVAAAGAGSALAVLTDPDTDIGHIAYEMTLLVKRVGPHLATPPRAARPDGD